MLRRIPSLTAPESRLHPFQKGYNWYQQVDQGKSFGFGIKLWGVKIDDPRFKNTEYAAADFTAPDEAHSEIVSKPEIRNTIRDEIKILLN